MKKQSSGTPIIRGLKKIWRLFLPILKIARGLTDFVLLALRLRWRRNFSPSGNAFSSLSPLDVPVFVINLNKRPDRLSEVTENLKNFGFRNVQVIRAIDGPEKYPQISRGQAANLGCTESHLVAVKENLKPGQPIAVCEDDNQFLAAPEEIHLLISEFLAASEFDVLCLSARVRGQKVRASPNFHAVAWALAPAFYIAKPRALRPLIGAFNKSVSRLAAERRRGPFDQVWQSIQRYRLMFVVPIKRVARQKESHSDIQGKFFSGT